MVSVLVSHLAAPGSILGIPEFLFLILPSLNYSTLITERIVLSFTEPSWWQASNSNKGWLRLDIRPKLLRTSYQIKNSSLDFDTTLVY